MNKQLKQIFLFSMLLIIVNYSIMSELVIAQSNTDIFGRSYKVNVGDSAMYEYKIVLVNNLTFAPVTLQLDNDSTVPVNITQGQQFLIKVVVVNKNNTVNSVLVQEQLNYNGDTLLTKPVEALGILIMAFDNISTVDNFIKANTNSNVNYSISGDYLLSQSRFINTSNNWHTGWLQKSESFINNSDGSVSNHVLIERIYPNFFDLNSEAILNGIVILFVPIMFGAGAFLALRLKK